ncbi:unnamed protein product [Adineta ricciae]|uniref:Peptidase M14 domain-containing protein n=1 Tax=Adineta ricciae TaxID=249248 RepID=A0A815UR07_ADIRI|nr:unnamed protein product [Adineta ricciae]
MNRIISLISILVSLSIWNTCTESAYVQDKLVRLEPLTEQHLDYLRSLEDNGSLDFWTEITGSDRPIDVHIPANEYDQYVSEFKQYSLPFHVLVDNLQESIDNEQRELLQDRLMRQIQGRWAGQPRASIVGTYARYNDMVAFLQEKAAADPTHVEVFDIGRTFENRIIQGIVLKFNPSATRNIWIDCGIHAREWITPATCIWLIDQFIAEYNNNDATTRDLLNNWNVYIAPSLNPDGYEYSHTTSRLWRKNRSKRPSSTCYGVDLNRNYPWKWMTGGASSSPCSETYAGPSAGSEIETVGVVNFLQSKINTWDMYMSFHSYGQWWFTPYGYTTNLPDKAPANYATLEAAAKVGAATIQTFNQRKYAVGSVSRLLYIASGSTVDWAYDALNIPYSYTIELPPTQGDSAGFVLPVSLAPGVCQETYAGMKTFLAEVKKNLASSSSG